MTQTKYKQLEEMTESYQNGNRLQLFEYVESHKPQQLAELFHYIMEDCDNPRLASEVMTFIFNMYN
ncbi:MAG: hypothetical protein ACR2IJ_05195 [Fluviibacter sp.]